MSGYDFYNILINGYAHQLWIMIQRYYFEIIIVFLISFCALSVLINHNRKLGFRDGMIITFLALYVSLLIVGTIIGRSTVKYPFGEILEGWIPYRVDKYTWHLEPVTNILMFIPLSFLISMLLRLESKSIHTFRILLYTLSISFLMSMSIEILQALTKHGSFQLSDLAYNSIGGVCGVLLYLLVHLSKSKNKKEKDRE